VRADWTTENLKGRKTLLSHGELSYCGETV